MIAKVELVGCLTHNARGREFRKDRPQILTNPDDIHYYQSQSSFVVTMMNTEKQKVVEPVSLPKNEQETDIDDDDDDDDDDINNDDDNDDNDDDDDDIDNDDDDGDDDDDDDIATPIKAKKYSAKELSGLKKADLKAIAVEMNLNVDGTADELRKRIVKASK